MKLRITFLGRMDYGEALRLQERLVELRKTGSIPDTLLLVEHPPVLTLGRRGERANILASNETLEAHGVSIFEVNRGGDVTYHGPGQIVGYPIMDLSGFGKDIRAFVGKIIEVFVRMLKTEYGINACNDESKYTGVWVGNEKITAIGIAVQRWVTMHGFAFNVNTNLEHFKWIVPCGLSDRGVTSLSKILGKPQDMDKLFSQVAMYFSEVFAVEPVFVKPDELE